MRRHTKVVDSFPDGNSVLMLVAARLRHVTETKWGLRHYLEMNRLKELNKQSEQSGEQCT